MLIRRGAIASSEYTTIANAAIRDRDLPLRARGLLAYLLSHREGWEISSEALCAEFSEGVHTIRTCLRQLERLGYLTRRKERGERGRWTHVAVVTDSPGALFVLPDRTGGLFTVGGRPSDGRRSAVGPRVRTKKPDVKKRDRDSSSSPGVEEILPLDQGIAQLRAALEPPRRRISAPAPPPRSRVRRGSGT